RAHQPASIYSSADSKPQSPIQSSATAGSSEMALAGDGTPADLDQHKDQPDAKDYSAGLLWRDLSVAGNGRKADGQQNQIPDREDVQRTGKSHDRGGSFRGQDSPEIRRHDVYSLCWVNGV